MKRRDFMLKGLATTVAIGMSTLPVNAIAENDDSKITKTSPSSNTFKAPPPIPWGYVELDPEEAMKRGYAGYMATECGGGSFWSVLSMLREKIGFPYTLIPMPTKNELIQKITNHKKIENMWFHYGVGGIEGICTVCGSLNGISNVIEIALGPHLAKKVIRKLVMWYENSAFPTDDVTEYVLKEKPPYAKYPHRLPNNVVSKSPLCHVVVSRWCTSSGYASGSKQRSERCARIVAATAKQAVILMNAAIKNKLSEVSAPIKLSHETDSCRVCHYKGKNYEQGQFTRGFMECDTCHVDDIRAHTKAAPLATAFGAKIGTWMGAATIGTVAGVGSHLAISNIGGKKEEKDENNNEG